MSEQISRTWAWLQNEDGDPPRRCSTCDGAGWYVGHEDECYDTGDCNCSGVQMQCDSCDGTGNE